jgi:phosphomannomutase / phosphoglucomutase
MCCFRACDIRGAYPDEVNETLFQGLGQAVAKRWAQGREVLVGRDCRIASASLTSALIEGLQAGGATVLDTGVVPTPLINYGHRALSVSVSIAVTASHNPPTDHGLKLLLPHGPAQPADITWLAQQWRGQKPGAPADSTTKKVDLWPGYTNVLKQKWCQLRNERLHGSRFRVVIDPGNGAWSILAKTLLDELGICSQAIHDRPDGTFPERSPDCAHPGNLSVLQRYVLETRAHLGLAWDGDGDRLAVIDDLGRPMSSDQLTLLLLPYIEMRTGQSILLDVKMSRLLRRAIQRLGVECITERSAHCALERTMRERECVFGAEYSGHYFFRELGGADDGLFAALYVMHLALEKGPLSKTLDALPQFHITPDMRVTGTIADFEHVRAVVQQTFDPDRVSLLDGVRVDVPEGWFLVRPSVSEDKLSIRAEGETQQALERILETLLEVLAPAVRNQVLRHYLTDGVPPVTATAAWLAG